MFVLSMKTTRPRIAAFGLVLALLLTVMVVGGRGADTKAVVAGGDDAARVSYLQAQGYKVEPQWTDVREITVSETTETIPSVYRGKRVKCFTYAVAQGDPVCLYEYDGKIIGAHRVAAEG